MCSRRLKIKIPPGIPIYGDILYRDKKCRQESSEQQEYFLWLKENRPKLHAIAIHPKNEGKRSFQQAALDRAQGSLNKGASDIIIPALMPFVCELKRVDHTCKGVTMRTDQVAYLNSARDMGAFICIALGAKAAIEATLAWEVKNKELIVKIAYK